MNKENLEILLKKVANNMTAIKNTTIDEVCPISIIDFKTWEWAQGVGLYGLYNYYKASGDKVIFDALIKWYDDRIEEGLPYKNVNTMAPMLTLVCIYEETKDSKYIPLLKEWANWVMEEMPRTNDGGLQHIGSGVPNPQQIWDDTLFMTVLFLTKFGVLFDRKDCVEESVHQFLVHIKYLFDKNTGLWFHGWTFINNDNFGGILWGRGNCWITACICDYIEMTGLSGGIKQYLIDTLINQIDGLKKFQMPSGTWCTIINDTNSYEEISATAGFGYGILKAVRIGLIPESYKEMGIRALQAVIDNIADDGTVLNVSYGTGMGDNAKHYLDIPICPMAYGNALAIMILSEGLIL